MVQTLCGWHPGIARKAWSLHWLSGQSPLNSGETSALVRISASLTRGGVKVLRDVFLGNCLDQELLASFDVVRARARSIVDAEWPRLEAWELELLNPPAWTTNTTREMERLFCWRPDEEREVGVFLLPSPPKRMAGNGDMFVPSGATSFACSGASLDRPVPWLTLLHEVAHVSHEPERLFPLIQGAVAQDPERPIWRDFPNTPPGQHLSLAGFLGEVVIHCLVPHGLLAPDKGRKAQARLWSNLPPVNATHSTSSWDQWYDAWVTRGSHDLLPALEAHVDLGGTIDSQALELAVAVLERMVAQWQR